jgi:hypothetical protein
MKLLVQRASDGDAKAAPVPEAEHIPLVEEWIGGRKRSAWAIEMNTLDELIAFTDKYGDCVIVAHMYCTSDYHHKPFTAQDTAQQPILDAGRGILIYDDFID